MKSKCAFIEYSLLTTRSERYQTNIVFHRSNDTVCPRSLDAIFIVAYYKKMDQDFLAS